MKGAPLRTLGVGLVLALAPTPAGVGQVRDRGADPTGRATITGVVTADEADATPLRRVIVTAAGGGLRNGASAITDDAGRFAIGGLPAGRYTITAAKAAYLTSAYGARRPGRPGTPLILSDGQQADVVIRMARGAVIEGHVRDEDGQPVPGIDVYALDARNPGQIGLRITVGADTATTDDQGRYRIYGLAPGRYIVVTSVTPAGAGRIGRRRDAEVDALLEAARRRAASPGATHRSSDPAPEVGYPVTYYPGVPAFAHAAQLDLAAGDERLGLDFALVPVATSTVDGVVLRSDGQPPSAVQLSMHIDGPRVIRAGTMPILVQPPDQAGRFRYAGLPPGRYTIYARSAPRATPPPPPAVGPGPPPPPRPPQPVSSEPGDQRLSAVAEFEVAGQDISGVTLVMQPGVTLSGRVRFDATSATSPFALTDLVVDVSPVVPMYSSQVGGTTFGNGVVGVPPAVPNTDGTFAVRNLAPGRYRFWVRVPPSSAGIWWIRSALLDGRDLLDSSLDVGQTDLTDVVLTFTDRRTELAGTLQSATGLPAPEYFVVVFPADRATWHAGSRRIKSTRPDTTGAFSMRDLPPGAYLLAALTDLEPADLEDERFLEEMAAQAIAVTIAEGGRTEQNLRIAR